jgi:outer membrane protein
MAHRSGDAALPATRHSRWTRTTVALAACLLLGSAGAQTLRLGAVLDLARSNDAQFAAARAGYTSGLEKLPQAQAANRPQINLLATNRMNRDGSTAYNGGISNNTGGVAISATQPLFRLANQAAVEQAELQVQLARQQLLAAEQDLLLRVAKAYFDVLQSQDELTAAGAQKEALIQQLNQARRGFEVGMATITELNEAQARHDISVAQEIAARGDLASRKRVLEKSIARPLDAERPLARLADDAGVALIDDRTQDTLLADAGRTSLQVQVARSAATIAEREIGRREAGHHPTLDLVGSWRRDYNLLPNQFGTTDTRQASIGVELNMPLYQGGLVASRVREARADLDKAQQELSNAERQARLDAQQAQVGLGAGAALTQALQQALKSAETQVRSTRRGLEVGVRTRVDVLNAEQQLFATRKDLAAARYRTLLAGLQLRAAAGQLSDADLRTLDSLLRD